MMLKNYTKTVDMDSILTAYAKTTEVEKMIEDSIGIALGGEY